MKNNFYPITFRIKLDSNSYSETLLLLIFKIFKLLVVNNVNIFLPYFYF